MQGGRPNARQPTHFWRSIVRPSRPSTCMMVLTVSIGIRLIRQAAAAPDAHIVFTPTGSCRVVSELSSNESIPAFAAVSPCDMWERVHRGRSSGRSVGRSVGQACRQASRQREQATLRRMMHNRAERCSATKNRA
eukprot:SAG25_NODE_137_length_14197_cov_30.387120_19_plen_135_part_00